MRYFQLIMKCSFDNCQTFWGRLRELAYIPHWMGVALGSRHQTEFISQSKP